MQYLNFESICQNFVISKKVTLLDEDTIRYVLHGLSEESCKDYWDRSGQFEQEENPSERVFIFYKPVSFGDGNQKPSSASSFTPKEVARLHPTIVSVTLFFTEPYTSLHSTFCHHNAHVSCNNRHKRQLVSRAELQLSREAVSRVAEAKKNYKGGTGTTLTRRLESEHAKNSKRGQF